VRLLCIRVNHLGCLSSPRSLTIRLSQLLLQNNRKDVG
jgi:hypothetical protein